MGIIPWSLLDKRWNSEAKARGKSAVGSRYRATASKDNTIGARMYVIMKHKVESSVCQASPPQ
jgi:hypothetical protein